MVGGFDGSSVSDSSDEADLILVIITLIATFVLSPLMISFGSFSLPLDAGSLSSRFALGCTTPSPVRTIPADRAGAVRAMANIRFAAQRLSRSGGSTCEPLW